MSLGQGQARTPHLGLLGRFAAGFAGSSFVVLALLSAIGSAVGTALSSRAQLVVTMVIVLTALSLDAYSLARRTWCPLTLRRQTPQKILYEHGARRAAVAWGLDTGLLFTTYRMSSIGWALFALALIGVVPWWIGIAYAAGFLVPLVLGCSVSSIWSGDAGTVVLARALAPRAWIARTLCVAALTVASVVVGGALAWHVIGSNGA